MDAEKFRRLSIETSMVAVTNISSVGHTGLVTLKMEKGVVRRVWCGTKDGTNVWKNGETLIHLVPNVEHSLEHG